MADKLLTFISQVVYFFNIFFKWVASGQNSRFLFFNISLDISYTPIKKSNSFIDFYIIHRQCANKI